MQQFKISTIAAILVTGVLLGTAVDAMLNVGDTFNGNVTLNSLDVISFEGLEGEKFTTSCKAAKGQSLIPNLKLKDPDGNIVAEGFGQGKKFALKGIVPRTYERTAHATEYLRFEVVECSRGAPVFRATMELSGASTSLS